MSRAQVGIIRVGPEHDALLASFLRQVWDPAATTESVRAGRSVLARANPARPGEEPPTFLFLRDGTPVGHVTTIPAQIWCGGASHDAHFIKGLHVLPEYRNGPIGFLLLRHAVGTLGCVLSIAVEEVPRAMFQRLGFTDLGVVPNFLRVIDGEGILRRLDLQALGLDGLPSWLRRGVSLARIPVIRHAAGAAIAAGNHLLNRTPGSARYRTAVVALEELESAAIDALWQRCRPAITAAVVRDATSLRARFSDHSVYRLVEARDREGTLAGLAVVRRPRQEGDPRLKGIRVAALADVLYPPAEIGVGVALMRGAQEAAHESAAHALLCSASDPRTIRLLRRSGFIAVPGNLHLLVRDGDTSRLSRNLSDWWITRADGHADEVF